MSKPGNSEPSDGFATDWIEVRKAGHPETEDGKAALARLIENYRPGLKAYLCGRLGLDRNDVDDVLQAFIEKRVIQDQFIARADQERGSFRAFLLSALHNFVTSDIRRRNSLKRSPEHKILPLDYIDPDRLPCETPEPGDEAEIAWAQAVIAGALLDMHNELERTGRKDIWQVFVGRVLRPLLLEEVPMDYTALIQQFGFKNPAQALNTLVTAKRIFRRHLASVVAQYAGNSTEVDEELENLHRILRSKPGR